MGEGRKGEGIDFSEERIKVKYKIFLPLKCIRTSTLENHRRMRVMLALTVFNCLRPLTAFKEVTSFIS